MPARDEGAFIVLIKTNTRHPKVLLHRRKNTGLYDGQFAFPGGKRNNMESLLKAAVRELREETGLVVKKSSLQMLRQCVGVGQDGIEWRSTFYVAQSWDGKPKVRERSKHDKIRWYSVNKLPKNVAPTVLEVISDLTNKAKQPERPIESYKKCVRKFISKIAILLKVPHWHREVLIL
jgi:8-oxo-dGTP diphosphatase